MNTIVILLASLTVTVNDDSVEIWFGVGWIRGTLSPDRAGCGIGCDPWQPVVDGVSGAGDEGEEREMNTPEERELAEAYAELTLWHEDLAGRTEPIPTARRRA